MWLGYVEFEVVESRILENVGYRALIKAQGVTSRGIKAALGSLGY